MVGANIKHFLLIVPPFFFAITIPVACIIDMDDITTTPNDTPPTTVEGIDETTNYIDYDNNSTDDAFPPQPKYNCEGKICVTKCCPKGSLFDYETSCSNVEDYNTSDWKPKFETELGDKLYLISKMASLPKEEKYKSYVCLVHGNEEFTLKEDGTVYFTSREESINHDFYCIDNFYNNGSLSVGAALCYDNSEAEFAAKADEFLLGGVCTSCVSLALLLLLYCKGSPFKRNLQAKCTIASCISLLFGFSTLVFNMVSAVLHRLTLNQCVVIGVCNQFFLLSFYFWLNVMCYEISRIIRGTVKMQPYRDLMMNESRRFLFYSAYAWGLPLLVCLVTITLQYLPEFSSEVEGYIIRPGIGEKRCWMEEETGALYAYYYSIEITLHVVNTLFMAHTTFLVNRDKFACLCCKADTGTSTQLRTHSSKNYLAMFKQQLMIYILYIFIWGLNVITLLGTEAGVSRIIDVIVSLQGLFLFIIVVASKKSFFLRKAYEKMSGLVTGLSTSVATNRTGSWVLPLESSGSITDQAPSSYTDIL